MANYKVINLLFRYFIFWYDISKNNCYAVLTDEGLKCSNQNLSYGEIIFMKEQPLQFLSNFLLNT